MTAEPIGAEQFATAAFLLGKDAGQRGFSTFTNPYPAGTPEYEQWRQGYDSTQQEAA